MGLVQGALAGVGCRRLLPALACPALPCPPARNGIAWHGAWHAAALLPLWLATGLLACISAALLHSHRTPFSPVEHAPLYSTPVYYCAPLSSHPNVPQPLSPRLCTRTSPPPTPAQPTRADDLDEADLAFLQQAQHAQQASEQGLQLGQERQPSPEQPKRQQAKGQQKGRQQQNNKKKGKGKK